MIFRQETLQKKAKQIKQKKKKNEKNRVRNKILNFRVSPEELEVTPAFGPAGILQLLLLGRLFV